MSPLAGNKKIAAGRAGLIGSAVALLLWFPGWLDNWEART